MASEYRGFINLCQSSSTQTITNKVTVPFGGFVPIGAGALFICDGGCGAGCCTECGSNEDCEGGALKEGGCVALTVGYCVA